MLRLTRAFARNVQIQSTPRAYLSSVAHSVPSNLTLADERILDEPVKINFPDINYSYATLDVPQTIEVRKFLSPGELAAPVAAERRIFEVAIRRDIVHDVIRYVRHKLRQPKKTKRLNEISGSKKKPRPQKGTGQAQVGNKRNSVWRGGQKAFGPVLRDYSIKLNRKVRALGMMMVIAARYREGNLLVFDSLGGGSFKTKDLHELLEAHGIKDSSVLFLDDAEEESFTRASGNLSYACLKVRKHTSVYEILQYDKLAVTLETFEDIQRRLIYQYTYNGKRKTMMNAMRVLEESNAEEAEDEDEV
ncbi:ribosomal protein L4/L1 family-domain-containing protein [Ochromonadaceae sp. CCMP2298]|nr:ribosomal protein L4/L1 family-domain-containing protein [Ochromonadaceae sp. CCMP2298]|mmetsp:Transcript_31430/g.69268  ORF Transcript_31430/g.69268 Transcript_31430/m.69268 type:complete len:304 (+) Transcript_31430:98-1009(+)